MILALMAVSQACGQAKESKEEKPAAQKETGAAAADSARLERFLRRYFNWPPEVKITIGPLKPSKVAGLSETKVQLEHQGQKQEATFLVSAGGEYVMQGPALAVNEDPFAATRAKIDTRDSPSLGSPVAPVTIVEYSDFQCSYCRGMATVLREQVPKAFPSDVRIIYKDFPLTEIHPWAVPAAALGRCIHKRYGESFWPYHDWVFANQPQLSKENFKVKAAVFLKEKGLDADQLGACMEKDDVKAEVQRSLAEGQAVGVSGTPTLFLNGRRLVGNQPFSQLRQNILNELDYAKGK